LTQLYQDGLIQEHQPGEFTFHPLLRDFLQHKLRSDDPLLAAEIGSRLIARSRTQGNYDEAFELAIAVGNRRTAVDIIAEASEHWLSVGHLETVERWLAASESDIGAHPGASLARAEVLLRRHRLGEAGNIARELLTRLTPSDPLASRAWQIAGFAAYHQSDSRQALLCYQRAASTAQTQKARLEALWGAILAITELEQDASALVEELESLAEGNLSMRIRTAHARLLQLLCLGDRRAAWAHARDCHAALSATDDAVAASSFLAHVAELHSWRARYAEALRCASRCEELCSTLRFSSGLSAAEFHKGIALMGLRRLNEAKLSLDRLRTAAEHAGDSYFASLAQVLAALMRISEGDIGGALKESRTFEPPTRYYRGYVSALASLAFAATGDVDRATHAVEEARMSTGETVIRALCDVAELIASCHAGSFTSDSATPLVTCLWERDLLQPLMIGYRIHPPLIRHLSTHAQCRRIIQEVLTLTNDLHLLHDVQRTRSRTIITGGPSLTGRELEVLRLLCNGLTNREIAEALYIAPSTAKVHVRHILRKLNARSRVHAILIARRLGLTSDAPLTPQAAARP